MQPEYRKWQIVFETARIYSSSSDKYTVYPVLVEVRIVGRLGNFDWFSFQLRSRASALRSHQLFRSEHQSQGRSRWKRRKYRRNHPTTNNLCIVIKHILMGKKNVNCFDKSLFFSFDSFEGRRDSTTTQAMTKPPAIPPHLLCSLSHHLLEDPGTSDHGVVPTTSSHKPFQFVRSTVPCTVANK